MNTFTVNDLIGWGACSQAFTLLQELTDCVQYVPQWGDDSEMDEKMEAVVEEYGAWGDGDELEAAWEVWADWNRHLEFGLVETLLLLLNADEQGAAMWLIRASCPGLFRRVTVAYYKSLMQDPHWHQFVETMELGYGAYSVDEWWSSPALTRLNSLPPHTLSGDQQDILWYALAPHSGRTVYNLMRSRKFWDMMIQELHDADDN